MKLKTPTLLLTLCMIAAAQSKLPSGYPQKLASLKRDYDAMLVKYPGTNCSEGKFDAKNDELRLFCNAVMFGPIDIGKNESYFAQYVVLYSGVFGATDAVSTAFGTFLHDAEVSRIDEQTGAGAGSGGTTSAVSRVGITDFLNLAIESGAITQSANGTSATLQANALSLYRFLSGQREILKYCLDQGPRETKFAQFLEKLTGTSTFDVTHPLSQTATGTTTASTASGTTTPVTASVLLRDNAVRLSTYTVRFEVYNKFNLRSQAYRDAFKTAFASKGLGDAAEKLITESAALKELLLDQIHDDFKLSTRANMEKVLMAGGETAKVVDHLAVVLEDGLRDLVAKANSKKLLDRDALAKFLDARTSYLILRDAALKDVQKTTASGFSLEYTNSKPLMQPRTSNFKAIYAWHPASGDANITFNFAATLYETQPVGTTGKWKDLQAALQLDKHFGQTKLGDTTFTLAGYYQYQHEASALQIGQGDLAPGTSIQLPGGAATFLAPKGHLAIAQALITVKAGNSGSKIPIGFTWANRTELIKSKEVRGHIGYTFDWDSILGAISGKGN